MLKLNASVSDMKRSLDKKLEEDEASACTDAEIIETFLPNGKKLDNETDIMKFEEMLEDNVFRKKVVCTF